MSLDHMSFLEAVRASQTARTASLSTQSKETLPTGPIAHLVPPELQEGFRGGGRFALQRRLGAGTFGVVFEAVDLSRGERVALKLLRRINPTMIFRFKQEFRSLSGLIHPNLVSLYELVHQDGQWFFTMELVEGDGLLPYLYQDGAVQDLAPTTMGHGVRESGEFRSVRVPGLSDSTRLRGAFRQLAEGVSALHASGKLHRDIKPSNIMVTREGRLVLLDFGLVTEQGLAQQPQEHHIVGTALYMSPEQAAASPLGQASDWYSVGVILYQALTGQLPFEGTLREVLGAKQARAPQPVRVLAPGAPEDLAALADALLAREARQRPSEDEILRRLGAPARPRYVAAQGGGLIGRSEARAVLRESFAAVKRGEARALLVHGQSGMGKSALVRHFLGELIATNAAEVLGGRCYEREDVPYKAADSIIDALSHRVEPGEDLQSLGLSGAERAALARLFPVLAHLGTSDEPEVLDPQDLRLRAFAALRALFAGLAQRRPLVLFLDDLQWGDLDSAMLFEAVLQAPCPPLLLIGSYRTEEAGRSPFLKSFLVSRRVGLPLKTVEIGPLLQEDAVALARARLGDLPGAEAVAARLAREAGGSPYFLDELASAARVGEQEDALSLDQTLLTRIRRLPAAARELLAVLAVAGRPLPIGLALAAAGISSERRQEVSQLHLARLIEAHGARRDDLIETYHDRIRESLASSLSLQEQQQIHRRLADELLARNSSEHEALVTHLTGAGDEARAVEYAERAAEAAASALAFERAASLYRLAISLRGEASPALSFRLAECLTSSGFSAEAAGIYRELAQREPARSSDWKERAAREYIKSGRIDDGVVLLREVLSSAGIPMRRSSRGALLSTLWGRAALWFRGLNFVERSPEQVPALLRRQMELCWTVCGILANADTTISLDYQTRFMRLALKAGDPYYMCRALGVEATYLASDGISKREASLVSLYRAKELAARINTPLVLGALLGDSGYVSMLFGEWRSAYQENQRAAQYLREHCGGMLFEASTAQVRALWSQCYLGEFKDLAKGVAAVLSEAEVRGDLYAATSLRGAQAAVLPMLAQDAAREAQEALRDAIGRWSPAGFHVQHYNDLIAQGEISLYQEDGPAALAAIERAWPALSGSILLFAQVGRIEAHQLRARAALAAALRSSTPAPLLALAEKDAKRLLKEKAPWGDALAKLLLAGVYQQRGAKALSLALLRDGIAACDATEMAHYATAGRLRLAAVAEGEEAREAARAAARYLEVQEVQRPEHFAALFAPGW